MDTGGRCDICGDKGTRDDPVVEYIGPDGPGYAHIECAIEDGWEV